MRMLRTPKQRNALHSVLLIGGACIAVGWETEGVAQAPPPVPPPAPTVVPPPAPPPLSSVVLAAPPPPMPPPPAGAPLLAQPPPVAAPPPPPPPQEEYDEEPRSRRAKRRTREPRPINLEWKPGEAIPTGYEAHSGPAKRLLISGLVTFGSVYVGSSIAAYIGVFAGSTELAPLFAPAIGPFIAVETTDAEGAGAYLLVLNGLVQTAGLTLSILSGFIDDTWLTRLPSGLPLDDMAGAPRIRANAGVTGGSFAIDF